LKTLELDDDALQIVQMLMDLGHKLSDRDGASILSLDEQIFVFEPFDVDAPTVIVPDANNLHAPDQKLARRRLGKQLCCYNMLEEWGVQRLTVFVHANFDFDV
jgi:hypothetical protein